MPTSRPTAAVPAARSTVRGASLAGRVARRLAAVAVLGGAVSAPAGAQAFYYPSFQVPRVTERDYTGAVVANAGTTALFQWREGLTSYSQLSLDVGLADYDAAGTSFFVGGQWATELTRSRADQPLDVLFTAGAGVAVGDGPDVLRIPVGVSLGHRFALEGPFAITPYVHPRLSLDVVRFGSGDGRRSDTDLTIDFDLGASFEISPRLALRATVIFSGSRIADDAGFGLGLTFTPEGLRARR